MAKLRQFKKPAPVVTINTESKRRILEVVVVVAGVFMVIFVAAFLTKMPTAHNPMQSLQRQAERDPAIAEVLSRVMPQVQAPISPEAIRRMAREPEPYVPGVGAARVSGQELSAQR